MENEGIVVRTQPYRDADLILRLISPTGGKISVLARGARKSHRKFNGGIELFDYGRFLLKTGRGSLQLVSSYSPQKNFLQLRSSLEKLSCATFLCESFDMLVQEDADEDGAEIFDLLKLGLQSICDSIDARVALRCTYMTLLGLLETCGLQPPLQTREASAHALLRLIAHAEEVCSMEIKSKGVLLELIEALRKKSRQAA